MITGFDHSVLPDVGNPWGAFTGHPAERPDSTDFEICREFSTATTIFAFWLLDITYLYTEDRKELKVMIIITFEDFPDQVFPHLCCRDGSGQEHQLYEPPELSYETWQEWLSAMASANPQYRHEILDKTKDFVSELELAEKIRKNELDSIRAEERWLWILQRAD